MSEVGTVLSERYRLESVLAEELLGQVYEALDLLTGTRVLVKVLHPHLVHSSSRYGRFLREVRATSMVRHVNTVEMLDSGSSNGLYYLVMEHFPAHTLEDELKKGRIDVLRTAHIAAQIASAIGAAHQENVTHRALSPRNILLLQNAHRGDLIKVRDFGLSKLERFDEGEEESHLTEAGVHVGNTAYMAPEYIERDRFHPKGDLYALGCLMTTMLTGEPPFVGRAASVLTDHVSAAPPRPSERVDVPEWLDDIVVDLLAKNPSDRPGAYQVVARLEEGAGRSLAAPKLIDTTKAVKEIVDRAESNIVVVVALIGVLVLVGSLVVGFSVASVLLVFALNSSSTIKTPPSSEFVVEKEPVVPRMVPDSILHTPQEITRESPKEPALRKPPPPKRSQEILVPTPAAQQVVAPDEDVIKQIPAGRSGVKVSSNRRVLILIDGTAKGMSPLTEKLPPGVHRVAAMIPGKPETKQEQRVKVIRGETFSVTFTF